MKSLGSLLLIAGILLGIYALRMDTSVSVDYNGNNTFGLPERVNNIGLMNDKQNYLIFSGVLAVVGLILYVAFASDKKVAVKQISPAMIKFITEGDKLAKAQKFEEATEKYNSALTYSDKAPVTNFKLVKLFSLKQDGQNSLNHLAKAIQQGFNDFEKVNYDNDLSFLRSTTYFKIFVDNGYKMQTTQTEVIRPLSRIYELEKLNGLLEKGVLTKEEFENEKKKILSSGN